MTKTKRIHTRDDANYKRDSFCRENIDSTIQRGFLTKSHFSHDFYISWVLGEGMEINTVQTTYIYLRYKLLAW